MQIAQIVVKTRTTKEDVFDYQIPPEILPKIKIGILVEVPFRNRKIEGIIVGLKRRSKIEKIKSITKIIDSNPVVDQIHIQLAEWMSDYYLTSFGKTLFENIVPPAKRTINKMDTDVPTPIVSKHSRTSRKYLVVADFQSRLNFYLKAIEKNLTKNRSVIILIPDLSLATFFTKHFSQDYTALNASLTKTERWQKWNKIREGKSKIIIGSQSALFAPAQNLGLIIIDQEENETYKSDRSPRINAQDVARRLADLSGADLILGSLVPRIETYYAARKHAFKLYKKTQKTKSASIINMNFEKSIISNSLENAIGNVLSQKKKALIVLNRKGEGSKFSCVDCGWIAVCEKCGLPLIPQKTENVCYRCEKTSPPLISCPKCQGVHLKSSGIGTTKLNKILSGLFPQANIIQVEKEHDSRGLNAVWDIGIATNYALKFQFPHLGLVALIDADQTLNFPDFNSTQKTFGDYYKFLRLGEDKIIQTHLSENEFIRDLAKMNYDSFFSAEIASRQKFNYPPFVQLIKLEYRDANEAKCQSETKKVYEDLKKHGVDITAPYVPFIVKIRNKFRYQIVLKLKNNIPFELKNALENLPSPWIVDVDPSSLL